MYTADGVAPADFCVNGGLLVKHLACDPFCPDDLTIPDDLPTTILVTPTGFVRTCTVTCACVLAALPNTMHITLDSSEPALDGLVIEVTRGAVSADEWDGWETIAGCDDCNRITANVKCVDGQLVPTVYFGSDDICGETGSVPGGCVTSFTLTGIKPISGTGVVCYPTIGAAPCFGPGSFTYALSL